MNPNERDLRYLAKVDERGPDECWPWLAGHNPHGYGTFRGDGEQLAHRHGYRLRVGVIPAGMVVCHSCDNPECQNPAHWFLGTPRDNNEDKMRKGRHGVGYSVGVTNGQAILADAAVLEIVQLYRSGATQAALGKRYGINSRTVGKIVRGERWQHLTGGQSVSDANRRSRGDSHHNAKITQAIADEIRTRYATGAVSQQALADEFGISQRTVSQIVRGLAWLK